MAHRASPSHCQPDSVPGRQWPSPDPSHCSEKQPSFPRAPPTTAEAAMGQMEAATQMPTPCQRRAHPLPAALLHCPARGASPGLHQAQQSPPHTIQKSLGHPHSNSRLSYHFSTLLETQATNTARHGNAKSCFQKTPAIRSVMLTALLCPTACQHQKSNEPFQHWQEAIMGSLRLNFLQKQK